MRVFVFDKWHRNSGVCKDIIRDYETELERQFAHHKDLRERLAETTDRLASRDQEILVLKKIGATGVHREQHMQVVGECERLKFVNDELTRDVETLKQRIYDLEHPAPDTTIVRVTGPLKEPKRPKKVMDRPKVKDIVIVEPTPSIKSDSSFREFIAKKKAKMTKKPIEKVTKRGQKRGL
jgi:hypothetical protein